MCREGDTLVVWKLDRLARNTKQLIETVEDLEKRKITFTSLTESIDTSGAVGKLVFNIFASIAQFERDMIRERVLAGLEAARRRGKVGGRKKVLTKEKILIASTLLKDGTMIVSDICNHLNISRSSFYNHFKGGRYEHGDK
jgi:DNA invertase Pin-like site-specific DNA recombinase